MALPSSGVDSAPRDDRVARRRFPSRLALCLAGLAVFGAGIALIVESELGNAPWDVFHQGLADRLDVGIGIVIIATGLGLMLLWLPLRVRPGLGTILNAVVIGVVVDVVLPLLPETDLLVPRIAYLVAGIVMMGVGTGMYLGSSLGPGPRDGLMTGLAARGWSVRLARTAIEIVAMVIGVTLGGTIGVGTAIFAVSIGPLVQFFLPLFSDGGSARPAVTAAGNDDSGSGRSRG